MGSLQGKKTIQADFKNLTLGDVPDEERQRMVLQALICFVEMEKEKPTSVSLQHCAVLKSKTLIPFLHEDLISLDLGSCSAIGDQDIRDIAEKCPHLKTLTLSGCSGIKKITGRGIFSTPPLEFGKPQELKGHTGPIKQLVSLQGGKKIASASYDNTIRIWDTKSGKELKRFRWKSDSESNLFSLEGGKKIAFAYDYNVVFVDVDSGLELKKFSDISGFEISEDGKKIVFLDFHKTFRILDIESERVLKEIEAVDGRFKFLKGDKNAFINRGIWNFETNQGFQISNANTNPLTSLISLEEGKKIASACDNAIFIWNVESGGLLRKVTFQDESISTIFSIDQGKKIVCKNYFAKDNRFYRSVGILDVESGIERRIFLTSTAPTIFGHYSDIYLSKGDKKIILENDNDYFIYDTESGQEFRDFGDKDRQFLPIYSIENQARTYMCTHRPIPRFYEREEKELIEAKKRIYTIWDIESGRELKNFTWPGKVNLLSFENGKKIISSFSDGKICIWNFDGLEHLYIEQCENLQSIQLSAPLKTLKAKKNFQLTTVNLEMDRFPQIDFNRCDKLNIKQTFKFLLSKILQSERRDIFPSPLSDSIVSILAEIVRENGSIRSKFRSLSQDLKKNIGMATTASNINLILNLIENSLEDAHNTYNDY